MNTRKYYIYSETAFHHQGDINYLKKLIDISKDCEVDGIKFQVLTRTNDFVSRKHSAYDQLNSYVFTLEQWEEIFEYTKQAGLDIILMPLNIESLKLLEKFSVKYIDIHSVSFNDLKLLDSINTYNIDIILGIGGRIKSEIDELINFFGTKVKVLMHGFQSFPSQIEKVNLGKISELCKMYPKYVIGYADHSSFNSEWCVKSNEIARIFGARIFEKHITLEEGVERVDSASACAEGTIKNIINRLDFIDQYFLNTSFNELNYLNQEEINYKNRELVCVANKFLSKGEIITTSDVSMKMIDVPIKITKISDVVGKICINDIEEDEAFNIHNIN